MRICIGQPTVCEHGRSFFSSPRIHQGSAARHARRTLEEAMSCPRPVHPLPIPWVGRGRRPNSHHHRAQPTRHKQSHLPSAPTCKPMHLHLCVLRTVPMDQCNCLSQNRGAEPFVGMMMNRKPPGSVHHLGIVGRDSVFQSSCTTVSPR
jgi:hypothetical protein